MNKLIAIKIIIDCNDKNIYIFLVVSGSNKSDTKRTPVFLGHCMTGSSAIWVLEPSQSLAFPLADNGNTFLGGVEFEL